MASSVSCGIARRLTPEIAGQIFGVWIFPVEQGLIGWGGRDRTFECWNQNPVPYHLATPQLRGGRLTGADPYKASRAAPQTAQNAAGPRLCGPPGPPLRGRGGIVIRAPPEARGIPFCTGSESSSAW
jgi:hypothetical protein